MQQNNEFRNVSELKPGDVLLCYCDPSKDLVGNLIHSVTDSEYCHAAIFYGDNIAVETRAKDGMKKGKVEKVNISDLVSRYQHVAVIRQPDAWASDNRVNALRLFIDKVVEREVKYNFKGILTFKNRKEFHETNTYQKLSDFFENETDQQEVEKHQYFCSEFVCDCFIAVGFILPSAAILYQSDTYSPGDLCKDPTFGTFWDYLTDKSEYKVSESDQFYFTTPYDVLFGA
ncbi:MAG: hypothetical protein K9K86_08020 [Pseudomonadales bacterium]|nr:hypothetical protein [Pseudomonadales bacterium]